jgi:hypothetical protein
MMTSSSIILRAYSKGRPLQRLRVGARLGQVSVIAAATDSIGRPDRFLRLRATGRQLRHVCRMRLEVASHRAAELLAQAEAFEAAAEITTGASSDGEPGVVMRRSSTGV